MGIRAIPTIFSTRTLYDNNNNNFDYRPVAMLSFAVQHQIFGGAPQVSHAISVVIYSCICVLIFVLLCRWFGADKRWLALAAALLFAVHPLHTEVVDNIKCRDELLATLFGLLFLFYTWKWHTSGKASYLAWSAVFILTGLLCKQSAIMYVLILPLSYYFFTDMRLRKMVIPFVAMFAICVVTVAITDHLLPEQKRLFQFSENPLYTDTQVPWVVKAATSSAILGWYGLLHIVPYPLSFYYGYRYVQLFYWTLGPVLSALAYAGLGVVVVKGLRKKTLAAFGVVIYVLCIFPFSNLLSPSPGMMAERFTFSSSLGYCIAFAAVLHVMSGARNGATLNAKRSKYIIAAFCLIFTGYAGMSIARNTLWRDSWTLFGHDIRHLRSSAKANVFYAEQVMLRMNAVRSAIANSVGDEKKKYADSLAWLQQEEVQAYRLALDVTPYYFEALANIGVSYINMDSFEQARVYLIRARAMAPGISDVHSNLATAFVRLGADKAEYIDSARSEFEIARRINVRSEAAYAGLVMISLSRKDTAAALSMAEEAIKNIPEKSGVYMQLAQLYLYKKDTARALIYQQQGAEVPNPDIMLLQILEHYYHTSNNREREEYYRRKQRSQAL